MDRSAWQDFCEDYIAEYCKGLEYAAAALHAVAGTSKQTDFNSRHHHRHSEVGDAPCILSFVREGLGNSVFGVGAPEVDRAIPSQKGDSFLSSVGK